MKRPRSFTAGCVLGLLCLTCAIADQPTPRPNVLFVIVDDLNDWVGFLGGHAQIRTPHMDRLAKRGIVFSNAHCAAPLCCPSRAAIFSGRQPFHTGIYTNGPDIRTHYPDLILIPQHFANHGYQTLGTGKLLHQRSPRLFDDYFIVQQRWSPFPSKESVAYTDADLLQKPFNPKHIVKLGNREFTLPRNGLPSDRNPTGRAAESFDWGGFAVPDEQMGDTQITTWAIDQLQRVSGPFFMAVGYYRPHIPLWAPESYFRPYPKSTAALPANLPTDLDDLSPIARWWANTPVTAGAHETVTNHDQWQSAVAAYLACVSFIDAQIGRLITALEKSSHASTTLVVLMSDHGWHLGEKQHWGKWTGWERSTRVPLLIVPSLQDRGRFAVGQKCHQTVGLIDVYPTLIDLCGLAPLADLDGESLVPSMVFPCRLTLPEITTFDEGNYSVRDVRWRFIRYNSGDEELYDHKTDPHEWHNLTDSTFSRVQRHLRSILPTNAAPRLERRPR